MTLDLFSAAVGGVIGFVINKAAGRFLDSRELARDALVDFGSTLPAIENTIAELDREQKPTDITSMRQLPSAYEVYSTTLPLDRLLAVFADEELHRDLMLFAERFRRFESVSKERSTAYYWLLDNPDKPWKTEQAAERVEMVVESKDSLRRYAADLAQYGYRVLERLYTKHLGNFSLRGLSVACARFLKETYKLDQETIALRRAYYSLQPPPKAFDGDIEYEVVVWRDGVALDLAAKKPMLVLQLEDPQTGQVYHYPFRAEVEVAIPRDWRRVGALVNVSDRSVEVSTHRRGSIISIAAKDLDAVRLLDAPKPRLFPKANVG